MSWTNSVNCLLVSSIELYRATIELAWMHIMLNHAYFTIMIHVLTPMAAMYCYNYSHGSIICPLFSYKLLYLSLVCSWLTFLLLLYHYYLITLVSFVCLKYLCLIISCISRYVCVCVWRESECHMWASDLLSCVCNISSLFSSWLRCCFEMLRNGVLCWGGGDERLPRGSSWYWRPQLSPQKLKMLDTPESAPKEVKMMWSQVQKNVFQI